MEMLRKIKACLVAGTLCAGFTVPLSAATTIFDNTVNDLTVRFNPGTTEVGDQILLAGGERYLTTFSFEYWGVNTTFLDHFTGTVQAEVRFYENTGPLFNGYAAPSATPFYNSGLFDVPAPTSRNTFVFTAGTDFPSDGLFLPSSDITWSVQFSGMASDDSVGVDIYSPPVVGQDYPDYWQNSGGWTLMTNSVATDMDFAAKMDAVPEPSALALSLCGGLGVFFWGRRFSRKG